MTSDANPPASLAEQAAHWWVLLNSDDVSTVERREFAAWVTQAPDRIAAYLRTAALMKAARSPSVRWPDTPPEALAAAAKASHQQGLLRIHELPLPARAVHSPERRIQWSRLAMATVTSLVVALGATWLALSGPQKFHTRFGEQRSILLEDGSRISLNTESAISVELRDDRRLVSLDAGEALFQVTHDPKRPFDVKVGGVVIRVVGTEFNIDRTPERTTIAVVEGRVAVSAATQAPGTSSSDGRGTVFLGAAERLVVDGSTPHGVEHVANMRAVLAWTEKKLLFDHTPLAQAAAEFNRYNKPAIQLRGAALQGREISGSFKADDPVSFLSFLARAPGVRIHDAPDGTHVVEQSP